MRANIFKGLHGMEIWIRTETLEEIGVNPSAPHIVLLIDLPMVLLAVENRKYSYSTMFFFCLGRIVSAVFSRNTEGLTFSTSALQLQSELGPCTSTINLI
ncbi:UNVERIFIED_CONTAM: hypothetical protein K2H54_057564 [Gekko kuhli]